MKWITIDSYPKDDRYPEPGEIVLILMEDEEIKPGRFDFHGRRWEWMELDMVECDGSLQFIANIRRQRGAYDPYIEKWAHMPKGSK